MTRSTKKPFGFVTSTGTFTHATIMEEYALKSAPEESKQIKDTFGVEYSGESGIIEPLYNPQALTMLSELNTFHARCCKVKATDTGGLGVKFEPVGDNPSENNKEILEEFIQNSVPLVEDMFTAASQDYEEVGWGILELLRIGDKANTYPSYLKHMPAQTTRIHKDENKWVQKRTSKTVWFKVFGYPYDVHKDTGTESPLGTLEPKYRANEVIVNKNYSSKSDYYGVPEAIPATQAIYGSISEKEYNIAFFKNHGVPAYAVFITGNYEDAPILDSEGNETGKSQVQDMIEKQFANIIENPHSIMAFSIPSNNDEGGTINIKFERLSTETKEASFRLFRQDNRDEIITAHGVDPYRVGVMPSGSLGGNLGNESKKNYKSSTLKPRVRSWEALINNIISSKDGFDIHDWKFKLVELDVEDQASLMLLSKDAVSVAAMTPNQVIRKFKDVLGLEESDHPAMDAHYMNGYAIDLDYEVQPVPTEVVKTLETLESELLEVAKQHVSTKNGSDSSQLFNIVNKLKGSTGMEAGSGK